MAWKRVVGALLNNNMLPSKAPEDAASGPAVTSGHYVGAVVEKIMEDSPQAVKEKSVPGTGKQIKDDQKLPPSADLATVDAAEGHQPTITMANVAESLKTRSPTPPASSSSSPSPTTTISPSSPAGGGPAGRNNLNLQLMTPTGKPTYASSPLVPSHHSLSSQVRVVCTLNGPFDVKRLRYVADPEN